MDPDSGHFLKICGIFMNKAEFSNFLSYFFFLKLDVGVERKKVFSVQFLVVVFPQDPGSAYFY